AARVSPDGGDRPKGGARHHNGRPSAQGKGHERRSRRRSMIRKRAIFLAPVALGALGALAALVAPASAQWTQVPGVSASDVFSVWTRGDTIVAGADSFAYVSTDAGVTWKRSAIVAAGVTSVRSVRIHNGLLYAGTGRFETLGQGVFVSDDLGDTWSAFNQGLFGPGSSDITHLLIHGDSLYASTDGSGAWVRNLNS